jgi:hypothetical protein
MMPGRVSGRLANFFSSESGKIKGLQPRKLGIAFFSIKCGLPIAPNPGIPENLEIYHTIFLVFKKENVTSRYAQSSDASPRVRRPSPQGQCWTDARAAFRLDTSRLIS